MDGLDVERLLAVPAPDAALRLELFGQEGLLTSRRLGSG